MSTAITMKGGSVMDKKIINISSKRQITIPQKFFTSLGFGNVAECIIRGNELVIRPARVTSGGEFAEEILEELIASGLSGNDLLTEFKRRQAQVRPAIEALLAESESVARGEGEYFTYDDVFGGEDDE